MHIFFQVIVQCICFIFSLKPDNYVSVKLCANTVWWKGRERGPNCRRKTGFLLLIINKTNKNNPVGKKQTGKTGQGRAQGTGHRAQGTGHRAHVGKPTYGNEPTRNCKHKEIIKGANEKGNEGEQLGKMYQ